MFSAMFSTLAWGAVIALGAALVALLAEGRGRKALELYKRKGVKGLNLDALDDATHENSDWRMVAILDDEQYRSARSLVRH